MSGLTERFDAICARIAGAAVRSGRPADAVRLVAVSKLHAAEAVAELARHWAGRSGRPAFGESYIQEAHEKMPRVRELLAAEGCREPEWHCIGHVQSRKARDVVGRFSLVHSVDSPKLARALCAAWRDRVAGAPVGLEAKAPDPQDILVQVNVGREERKSGVDPDALEPLLADIAAMPELRPRGLMCIPPPGDTGEDSRPYFAMLCDLRDRMETLFGISLPQLSMGMSGDFEVAVEEGATLVRIGTDIFGPRGL